MSLKRSYEVGDGERADLLKNVRPFVRLFRRVAFFDYAEQASSETVVLIKFFHEDIQERANSLSASFPLFTFRGTLFCFFGGPSSPPFAVISTCNNPSSLARRLISARDATSTPSTKTHYYARPRYAVGFQRTLLRAPAVTAITTTASSRSR